MAHVERLMRDAEQRAETQFDRRPKAPVAARPFQRFQEANAAANYTPRPVTDPVPGSSRSRCGLTT